MFKSQYNWDKYAGRNFSNMIGGISIAIIKFQFYIIFYIVAFNFIFFSHCMISGAKYLLHLTSLRCIFLKYLFYVIITAPYYF